MEWMTEASQLGDYSTEAVRRPKPEGQYHLNRGHCPSPTGFNDCEHGKAGIPDYFMLEAGEQETDI